MNTIFATNEKERAYVVQPGNIQNKGIWTVPNVKFLFKLFFVNPSAIQCTTKIDRGVNI